MFFYRILCGFFLGLSILAPGISGSVVAISMGIYHDLIKIAANPFENKKENIVLCIPLIIGGLISVILFVLTFHYLFSSHEKATYLLFVGLIIGSFPIIFKEIKGLNFTKRHLISGLVAFLVIMGFIALADHSTMDSNNLNISLLLFVISGLIAGASLVIPGMSTAMVLIILGVYTQLIFVAKQFIDFNFAHIIPILAFAVFLILGLATASKGIKKMFEKIPEYANAAIIGFMAGSGIGLLKHSITIVDTDFTLLFGGVMLLIGVIISLLFFFGSKLIKNN